MEMHQIKYFLAVAREQHISKAADKCNVSQPSLSRAIRKLEEEFGGPLFERRPGCVELTELGKHLKPMLQACFENAGAAKDGAAYFLGARRGLLRIGLMASLFHAQLLRILEKLDARYPNLDVVITQSPPELLITAVTEGHVDLAMTIRPSQEMSGALCFDSLYHERYAVCFPIGHRFEHSAAVPLDEVRGEAFVHTGTYDPFAAHQSRKDEIRPGRYKMASQCYVQAAVRQGIGCAIVPEFSPPGVGVALRPLSGTNLSREIGVMCKRGRTRSAATGAFVHLLKATQWQMSG